MNKCISKSDTSGKEDHGEKAEVVWACEDEGKRASVSKEHSRKRLGSTPGGKTHVIEIYMESFSCSLYLFVSFGASPVSDMG